MIVPHILPVQGRRQLDPADQLIGAREDESATNAVLDMHDVAGSIPQLPTAFKKSAISDLLEMWRLHLKTDSWIDGRAGN